MWKPAIRPVALWRGDSAPPVIWQFPFDLTGSDFRLIARFGGRQLVRQVTTGGLAMSTDTRRVTWTYQPSDFEALPVFTGVYELARILVGGETRTYVAGALSIGNLING